MSIVIVLLIKMMYMVENDVYARNNLNNNTSIIIFKNND